MPEGSSLASKKLNYTGLAVNTQIMSKSMLNISWIFALRRDAMANVLIVFYAATIDTPVKVFRNIVTAEFMYLNYRINILIKIILINIKDV